MPIRDTDTDSDTDSELKGDYLIICLNFFGVAIPETLTTIDSNSIYHTR